MRKTDGIRDKATLHVQGTLFSFESSEYSQTPNNTGPTSSSSCMNIYFLIYLFLHVCHWSMFEPGLSRFIILLHVPEPLLLLLSFQYLSPLFHSQEEWTKKSDLSLQLKNPSSSFLLSIILCHGISHKFSVLIIFFQCVGKGNNDTKTQRGGSGKDEKAQRNLWSVESTNKERPANYGQPNWTSSW